MSDEFRTRLAARRHVALRRLLAPGPDDAALGQILEAAGHAPDHGRLRPWRFVLIPAGRRVDLGEAFAEALASRERECDAAARTAAREKAFHAPCLLAAILVDDPAATSSPKAEKLVSLGCAIQNMLLAAQVLGFSSGLASGASMAQAPLRRLLGLTSGEEAICFIGFGTAEPGKPARERRQPIDYFSIL